MARKKSLNSLSKWEISTVLEHCGIDGEKIREVEETLDLVHFAFEELREGGSVRKDSITDLTVKLAGQRWNKSWQPSEFRKVEYVDDLEEERVKLEWL